MPTCFNGEKDSVDRAAVRLRYNSGVSSFPCAPAELLAPLVEAPHALNVAASKPGGHWLSLFSLLCGMSLTSMVRMRDRSPLSDMPIGSKFGQ
jgi:hypothetical protein